MDKLHKFVGFTTSGTISGRRQDWKIYDNDLIRYDLLLHFNTRLGDRFGRPLFGCRLLDLCMEQNTSELLEQIKAEVTRVIDSDPRILTQSVELYEYNHGVVVEAVIYNNTSLTSEMLRFSFDARQGLFE